MFRCDDKTSPSNIVDLITFAMPQFQNPCTRIRFQLEVTQIGHHNCVDNDRSISCAQRKLQSSWRSTACRIKAMSFQQKMFKFVFTVDRSIDVNQSNVVQIVNRSHNLDQPIVGHLKILRQQRTGRQTGKLCIRPGRKFSIGSELKLRFHNITIETETTTKKTSIFISQKKKKF